MGVCYGGVEPSPDLYKAALRDERLGNASLVQKTIRDYCNHDSCAFADAPTLISIIGVADLLADPEGDMGALFDFLARRKWLNVPLLVATFDPDFFLPGLPIHDDVRLTSAHYGVNETLRIRDPAVWETLFVNCGFHLLEQRPLHISSMPRRCRLTCTRSTSVFSRAVCRCLLVANRAMLGQRCGCRHGRVLLFLVALST
ncbi:MAG: hypothetical protein IPJ28_10995 [Betaproteobacteria bacterium]|nr:hypothetical protein [Betaproteobacteria bacterium]